MFSKLVHEIEKRLWQIPNNVRVRDVLEKAKSRERLQLGDLWTLLNINPEKDIELFDGILEVTRAIKRQLFHGEIYPIVPLYVSSICQEHCVYCNYRAENKDKQIQRVRLSCEELATEVEFLVKKGLGVIELVYATDPFITVDHICSHIKIVRDILSKFGSGMVGINARPYTVEGYKKLKESGLDFAVLWQETYDRGRYGYLHPGKTEKTNFAFRVNAADRMIQAGIEYIGLGVLSGMSNWRHDWYMLMNHVNYLLENYADRIGTIILGIPRLKPAAGAVLQESSLVPTDQEYLQAIATFNLFLPHAVAFVNTRETWDVCMEIAEGGGCLFTFDCKTIPGGYALGRRGYQFPTYNFTVEEHLHKLTSNNLHPVFDWNFDSLKGRHELGQRRYDYDSTTSIE